MTTLKTAAGWAVGKGRNLQEFNALLAPLVTLFNSVTFAIFTIMVRRDVFSLELSFKDQITICVSSKYCINTCSLLNHRESINSSGNDIIVKAKPANLSGSMQLLKDEYKRIHPDSDFKGSFLNENIERQY